MDSPTQLKRIKMFSHQKVTLQAYTQPVSSHPANSLEDFLGYAARVSNPNNQLNFETVGRLLAYCGRHKHWSIFEMGNFVLEIKTTRDIARQILRHRSFCFQEFSQRYASVEEDLVFRECRTQDTKNRQSSHKTEDSELLKDWQAVQVYVKDELLKAYRDALGDGIAKEQARALLPEGMTPSTMYMNGTVRSWLHYIELRAGNGTQLEHQDIALKCLLAIEELIPNTVQAVESLKKITETGEYKALKKEEEGSKFFKDLKNGLEQAIEHRESQEPLFMGHKLEDLKGAICTRRDGATGVIEAIAPSIPYPGLPSFFTIVGPGIGGDYQENGTVLEFSTDIVSIELPPTDNTKNLSEKRRSTLEQLRNEPLFMGYKLEDLKGARMKYRDCDLESEGEDIIERVTYNLTEDCFMVMDGIGNDFPYNAEGKSLKGGLWRYIDIVSIELPCEKSIKSSIDNIDKASYWQRKYEVDGNGD